MPEKNDLIDALLAAVLELSKQRREDLSEELLNVIAAASALAMLRMQERKEGTHP
jgi:hypothetical protein